METDCAATYERAQHHNSITTWLHSQRFRHARRVISDAATTLHRPVRVIDIGCAHAKLFETLRGIPLEYTGIEKLAGFSEAANARYGSHDNFRFIQDNAINALPDVGRPDVIVALEAMEHMLERDAVRLIEAIASTRPALFLCSVPVEIGPAIWLKNVGSLVCGYSRHREYTWAQTFWSGLYQLDKMPPHRLAHRGFDWRWLAQTIRHNLRIKAIHRLPFRFMPAALSTSIFIEAEPY